MYTRAYRRRNIRITWIMITAGVLAGLIFAVLSDGVDRLMPLLNAVVGGSLLGLYTALIEIRLMTPRFRRSIRFLPMMLLRIFIYTFMTIIILLLVFTVSRMFWFGLGFRQVWMSDDFHRMLREDFLIIVIYAVGVTGIVIFCYQIARKIGPNFLLNMITGNYYHPRRHRMIFMFLQIDEAESISRELGLLKFYNFFNDIIYDITPPLIAFRGHIYQYVDNEIVFYWYPEEGRKDAACIRAFYGFCDRLYENREKYLNQYGVYPVLKSALHIGDVIQGEIGYGKTEIDFSGDVLNTCSRILQKTNSENQVVISSDLKDMLKLPSIYDTDPLGAISLEGKSKPLALYRTFEKPVESMPE